MRVFVTGATGFIGSAVVKDLIAAGHQVTGLARAPEKAAALSAAGAQVLLGTLEDLDGLKRGAAAADGVIHCAFNHDFARYLANCEDDRRVIAALGAALAGSKRPLVVTSGTGVVRNLGRAATEQDAALSASAMPRAATEEAAAAAASNGANVSVVRLPQVHDTEKQGFVTYAVMAARAKNVSAYIGDGRNRWPASHVLDTARLYRLALERGESGAVYHAVAEEGVSLKAIAEAIARRLKVPTVSLTPEDAAAHFGWLAPFAGSDAPASSALTQQLLGWRPTGPSLVADLGELRTDG